MYSTFRFDLSGPSYLRPLVRRSNNKVDPGFLVADVLVGRALDEAAVSPFIKKCTTLSQLRRARPFLPMFIADEFTPEALRLCRSNGIVATRADTIFGQDVARALAELLQTLSNAAAVAATSPERLEKLFRSLGAIEGRAGNLRGALFELLVASMVRAIEGGSIDVGVLVEEIGGAGQRAEVDVRLVKERQVTIYECKGHQSSIAVGATEVE